MLSYFTFLTSSYFGVNVFVFVKNENIYLKQAEHKKIVLHFSAISIDK